jgi:predicted porin
MQMKNKLLTIAILSALIGTTQAQADQAPLVPSKAMATDVDGSPVKAGSNPAMLFDGADTTMNIYGIVEATLSRANHQTAGGGTTAGFQTSWFSGNRLGFDSNHGLAFGDDIGLPGLKVISKLETEFELPTGSMDTPNVLFNRDAWLGFYSEDLGKITLGRQNTLTRDFTANWGDPYGGANVSLKEGGYSNVNNFKQFIFYSGSAGGTRMNSAIEWKKKFGSNWLAGLGYGFGSQGAGGGGGNGGTVPGDFTKGTTQEASVAYNNLDLGAANLNVNASYDRANVSDLIHQSELVGGNVTVGIVRFNTGVVHYTAQQGLNNSMGSRTDNAWTTSVSFMPGKMKYDIGYQVMKGKNAGFSGGGNILNPFGNTAGVATVADGSKKTLYGSIIFRADKQTDFYVAADIFRVTGGWVVGDAQGNGNQFGGTHTYNSEFETAVGVRYKF